MGIFPVDGRASPYEYLVDKSPCYMIVDISHSVYTNTGRLFSPKQNNF